MCCYGSLERVVDLGSGENVGIWGDMGKRASMQL